MRAVRAHSLARLLAATTVAALAIVPIALLAIASVGRHWYWPSLVPTEWSLRGWDYLLSDGAGVGAALGRSLGIAAAVALIAVAAALPAARVLAFEEFRGKRLLLFALLLPVLTPPLAAAMGVHAVFLRAGLADSVVGVTLVHLIPAVPYATLMLTGSFANFDRTLEDQARTLGATPWAVWTRVTLPILLPGIIVAATFAFLISWSQYLLTLIIGGGRVITLPLLLVAFQRAGDDAVGAAMALVFIAPTLVLFALVARHMKEL
ncbi:MAG: ABC transporter permease subunit [Vicinamibacterales bacterium]